MSDVLIFAAGYCAGQTVVALMLWTLDRWSSWNERGK